MSADNVPQRRSWSWPFGKPEGELELRPSSIEDRRDMRDPEKLGRIILDIREQHCSGPDHPDDCGLSRIADFVDRDKVYEKVVR